MKKCNKHGELKDSDIKSGVYKGKPYKKCRICENARAKAYAKKNKEKVKEKDKKYWVEKKEIITKRRQAPEKLAKRREWDKNNRDKYAPYYREKQAKYRDELATPYIKKRIQNGDKMIAFSDITDSMVELQRAIFKTKSAIKNLKLKDKMGTINGKNKKR